MNRTQTITNLSKVLDLEMQRNELSDSLKYLHNQVFPKSCPKKPIRYQAPDPYVNIPKKHPDYSNIKKGFKLSAVLFVVLYAISTILTSFSITGAILILIDIYFIMFLFIYTIYYRLFKFPNEDKSYYRLVKQSDWYKQEYEKSKKDCDNIQEKYDSQYAKELKSYEDEIIKYESEHRKWNSEICEKSLDISHNLENIKDELSTLYQNIGCIPEEYRNIAAISYILNVMKSTKLSIQDAIKSYNEYVNKMLNQSQLDELQYQSQLQDDIINKLQNQLNLQEDEIDVESKYRRDSNVWNALHAAQLASINKKLHK